MKVVGKVKETIKKHPVVSAGLLGFIVGDVVVRWRTRRYGEGYMVGVHSILAKSVSDGVFRVCKTLEDGTVEIVTNVEEAAKIIHEYFSNL